MISRERSEQYQKAFTSIGMTLIEVTDMVAEDQTADTLSRTAIMTLSNNIATTALVVANMAVGAHGLFETRDEDGGQHVHDSELPDWDLVTTDSPNN